MKQQVLKLKGKTGVFIDWANVYGWKSNLKDTAGCRKLFKYLKSHANIELINFYYGEDNNQKSKDFLKEVHKIGFNVTKKPVKYIVVEPIYQFLINKHKQVIVIYEQGHLGKEVWNIKKGLFKTRLSYLKI